MNSKRKGESLERRFMEILQGLGFKCEKARATYAHRMGGPPRSIATDIFGAFDLVAKRSGDKTIWVQVTTKNSSIASKAAVFKAKAEGFFDPRHDDVWIVRWHTPPKVGQAGHWQVLRWCDGFDPRKAYSLTNGARCLPWEGIAS